VWKDTFLVHVHHDIVERRWGHRPDPYLKYNVECYAHFACAYVNSVFIFG
jgi:hypothetical protein